jgi:hypothetical protein
VLNRSEELSGNAMEQIGLFGAVNAKERQIGVRLLMSGAI